MKHINIKRKFQIIGNCIITICLLTVSLKYLTDLMELKTSDTKYLPFLEQNEDFDVLFMGSSHVILGIYPMELWNDYGIVSYNMGGYGNQIAASYWVMENALEQTTPRLVVIDCMSLREEIKTSDAFSNVHQSFDAFPLNKTKLSAIQDLLDDPIMNTMVAEGAARDKRERKGIELWWNFSLYHTRWNELTKNDFQVQRTQLKGAEFRIAVAAPNEVAKIPAERKLEDETTGVQYLRKMIEDCQSRGIDVLLMYVPFPASEEEQMEANRVYDIAAEYGVNYINFLDMDIVDYYTDCYDDYSHLNPSGGHKVTEYVGQYITEHYDIPDQRTNPSYDSWNTDYKEYSDYKVDILKKQKALDLYLMLLTGNNFDVSLEINNPTFWENDHYVRLLKNLDTDRVIVTEHTESTPVTTDELNTPVENSIPDVRITVTDGNTGEIIDQADFSL